jgi:alkylglycerol monooxygenase
VYDFEKYDTHYSKPFLAWTWVQLIMLLLFVSYLFGNIASIGLPDIFVYGAFLFLFVYSFTDMMDGSRFSWIWETAKFIFGISIILYSGDWFGAAVYSEAIKYFLFVYFFVSLAVSLLVSFSKEKELIPTLIRE